jgi:hypothetical protein
MWHSPMCEHQAGWCSVVGGEWGVHSEFGQRLLVTIWFYCVSGFATSVVNCGTTRVPKGLPM